MSDTDGWLIRHSELQQVDGSLMVELPEDAVEYSGLEAGKAVSLFVEEDDTITLVPTDGETVREEPEET